MPVLDESVRLRHILEAVGKAITYSQGRTRADLDADELLALARVRLLEVIGEAAGRISEETRGAYPQIPWSAMTATRNRLIHGYFEVDLDIVWMIVTQDLPEIHADLESVLAREGGQ